MPAKAKILLAESNGAFRAQLQAALRHAGYTVYEARDPVQALAIQSGERCDVIITDMGSREKETMDALQRLRVLYRNTKLVVLAALPPGDPLPPPCRVRSHGAEAFGVDVVLHHPLTLTDVLTAVRALLDSEDRP